MPAGKFNFVIEQGTDLNIPVVMKNDDKSPFDLDGYTARMKIKSAIGGTTLDDLTTANTRIVIESFTYLGLTYWRIILKFPSSVTTPFTFDTGVYDLELVSPASVVTRLIEGTVTLSKEVTS